MGHSLKQIWIFMIFYHGKQNKKWNKKIEYTDQSNLKHSYIIYIKLAIKYKYNIQSFYTETFERKKTSKQSFFTDMNKNYSFIQRSGPLSSVMENFLTNRTTIYTGILDNIIITITLSKCFISGQFCSFLTTILITI